MVLWKSGPYMVRDTESRPQPERVSGRLLATRLAPPRSGVSPIARDRLIHLLDGGAALPLVVIAAAAGSGKTVLASEWVRRRSERGERTGWLSLDFAHNEPARFWRYFATAARASLGELPVFVERELGSTEALWPEERLGGLIEHLTSIDTTAVVVLDDYHQVVDESIHEHLAFLVEHGGSSICLVVLSRSVPPLHLARLRGRGLLAEIDAEVLALTVAETTELVNRELSTPLDPDAVDRLQEQTEGWPVGVYLASVSLARHDSPSDFISEVTGDEDNIVEYLGAELLSGLSDEERRFLFRSSILDRFCGPLCAAVTSQSNAPQILERLATGNCLIVSLDRRRYWHRYHHLFADLLRSELERHESAAVDHLHHRAATWFADHDLGPEAVSHAIAAQEWDLAGQLIGRYWKEQRNRGTRMTVVTWLEALPAGRIELDPALLVAQAWCWLAIGRLDEGDRVHERLADFVKRSPGPSDDVLAEFLISRAKLTLLRGDTKRALDDAEQAAGIEQRWDRTNPGTALTLVGAAQFWRDPAAARTALTTSIELAISSGHHGSVLMAQGYLAALEEDEGGERLAKDALRRAEGVGWRSHFLNSMPRLVLARCHRLRGQLDQAQSELDVALELARQANTPLRTAYCLLELAELQHSRNESAAPAMKEIRRLIALCPNPGRLDELAAQAAARLRIPLNLPDAAPSLVEPLTERELAVLGYLPTDLKQRQVAEALYVSTNTIKTQVQAIYRKLGVTSRPAAVRRASELNLLSKAN